MTREQWSPISWLLIGVNVALMLTSWLFDALSVAWWLIVAMQVATIVAIFAGWRHVQKSDRRT